MGERVALIGTRSHQPRVRKALFKFSLFTFCWSVSECRGGCGSLTTFLFHEQDDIGPLSDHPKELHHAGRCEGTPRTHLLTAETPQGYLGDGRKLTHDPHRKHRKPRSWNNAGPYGKNTSVRLSLQVCFPMSLCLYVYWGMIWCVPRAAAPEVITTNPAIVEKTFFYPVSIEGYYTSKFFGNSRYQSLFLCVVSNPIMFYNCVLKSSI